MQPPLVEGVEISGNCARAIAGTRRPRQGGGRPRLTTEAMLDLERIGVITRTGGHRQAVHGRKYAVLHPWAWAWVAARVHASRNHERETRVRVAAGGYVGLIARVNRTSRGLTRHGVTWTAVSSMCGRLPAAGHTRYPVATPVDTADGVRGRGSCVRITNVWDNVLDRINK